MQFEAAEAMRVQGEIDAAKVRANEEKAAKMAARQAMLEKKRIELQKKQVEMEDNLAQGVEEQRKLAMEREKAAKRD